MRRYSERPQPTANPVEADRSGAVTPALLRDIVTRVVSAISPDQIFLFGSRARGNARPNSDIDILIIADSDQPRYRRSVPLYGVLKDVPVPIDILVYTADEVREWADVPQAFVTTARREGKLLYEKH